MDTDATNVNEHIPISCGSASALDYGRPDISRNQAWNILQQSSLTLTRDCIKCCSCPFRSKHLLVWCHTGSSFMVQTPCSIIKQASNRQVSRLPLSSMISFAAVLVTSVPTCCVVAARTCQQCQTDSGTRAWKEHQPVGGQIEILMLTHV